MTLTKTSGAWYNNVLEKVERFVGVISDTHNLLRPEAIEELKGADLIIHAGDVCKPDILDELGAIAPVIAVRGNNDQGTWAKDIPEFAVVQVKSISIYVIHDIKDLKFDPAPKGINVVISGHSHKPSVKEQAGILYLNAGSAGRRRFRLPVTLARLRIDGENVHAEIVDLLAQN